MFTDDDLARAKSHFDRIGVRDPDGHRTELLLPGIQVIDIDDEPVRCLVSPKSNSNLWGLPAPRSWVEQATNFAGVKVRSPPVEGEPMTAEKYLAARSREAVTSEPGSAVGAGRACSRPRSKPACWS